MLNNRGKFIVFEGIDGAGKTSIIEALGDELFNRGISCIRMNNLTGNYKMAHELKEAMKDPNFRADESITKKFLEVIVETSKLVEAALKVSEVVLMDRWVLSSMVYTDIEDNKFKNILLEYIDDISKPDITILIDADDNYIYERLETRGKSSKYDSVEEGIRLRKKFYKHIPRKSKWYSNNTKLDKDLIVHDIVYNFILDKKNIKEETLVMYEILSSFSKGYNFFLKTAGDLINTDNNYENRNGELIKMYFMSKGEIE